MKQFGIMLIYIIVQMIIMLGLIGGCYYEITHVLNLSIFLLWSVCILYTFYIHLYLLYHY